MKTLPEGLSCIGIVMSSFDHEIEGGAEERLKKGGCFGGYPGWDFYGEVWWEEDQFYCQIKQYSYHTATLSAATLQGIMEQACERFGYA